MSSRTTTNATLAASEMLGALKERAQLAAVYFTDVERALVKATNRDLVVPKEKHVMLLVSATFERGLNLADMFKQIEGRLREPFWAVALKTLIVLHYLAREGDAERVLGYLGHHPAVLNMSGYRDTSSGGQGMQQSTNVKLYATYLEEKVAVYRELGYDLLRDQARTARLKTMTWSEGLGGLITTIQRQIKALLQARFFLDSVNNDITTEALRLLVKDLMALYRLSSDGVINLLKMFCTLPKSDAVDALVLYKEFIQQTRLVVEYFDMARKLQQGLGMVVPEIEHPPLSLATTLQEYLDSNEAPRAAGTPSMTTAAANKADEGWVDVFSGATPASNNANSNNNKSNNFDFFGSVSATGPMTIAAPQNVQRQATSPNMVADMFSVTPANQQGFNQQPQSQFNLMPQQQQQQPFMQAGAMSQPVLPSHQFQQQQQYGTVQQPLRANNSAFVGGANANLNNRPMHQPLFSTPSTNSMQFAAIAPISSSPYNGSGAGTPNSQRQQQPPMIMYGGTNPGPMMTVMSSSSQNSSSVFQQQQQQAVPRQQMNALDSLNPFGAQQQHQLMNSNNSAMMRGQSAASFQSVNSVGSMQHQQQPQMPMNSFQHPSPQMHNPMLQQQQQPQLWNGQTSLL